MVAYFSAELNLSSPTS